MAVCVGSTHVLARLHAPDAALQRTSAAIFAHMLHIALTTPSHIAGAAPSIRQRVPTILVAGAFLVGAYELRERERMWVAWMTPDCRVRKCESWLEGVRTSQLGPLRPSSHVQGGSTTLAPPLASHVPAFEQWERDAEVVEQSCSQ